MADDGENNDYWYRSLAPDAFGGDATTRRRFLELAGITGVGALAGCGGGGDDSTGTPQSTPTVGEVATPGGGGADTDTPTSDSTAAEDTPTQTEEELPATNVLTDKKFIKPQGFDLQNLQFNPHNPGNFAPDCTEVFSNLAGLDRGEGEWVPNLLSDWNVQSDAIEVTIDDRYTWHTGDAVTARDLVVNWRINRHMGGGGLWDYANSVEEIDERTARVNIGDSVNRFVLLPTVISGQLHVNRMQYGEYLDRFEEVTGDQSVEDVRGTDEHKQIQEDLRGFSPRGTDVIGSGPYQIVEQTQQQILAELYEDHPMAVENDGKLRHGQYQYKKYTEGVEQAFLADELDGREVVGLSQEQYSSRPDKLNVTWPPVFVGTGITFNRSHDIWGRRKVRQAMAHLFNRRQAVENAAGSSPQTAYQYPTKLTGLTGYAAMDPNQQWLGDAAENYSGYNGEESATERAAALLEEEGFSKQGSNWVTPDGERWTVTLKVTNADNWLNTMRTFNQNLSDFGISSEVTSSGNTTYFGETLANGDFDVALNWWGGGQLYPYFGFNTLYSDRRMNTVDRYPDGPNTEVEIPQEIGDFEGSSGMETVKPAELVSELGSASEESRQTELMQKLAWVVNYDLPIIQGYDWVLMSLMMGQPEWDLPADDSHHWRIGYPVRWLHQAGEVYAKPQN